MNYLQPTQFVDFNEYEYIVSFGNKCPTAMILKELNIYSVSFPFDYIPTTPELILKYLQSQDEFYPTKNVVRTKDDVWFGHFDINDKYNETIEKFKRRFARLFDILQNKKKILFVYTSEADIYNDVYLTNTFKNSKLNLTNYYDNINDDNTLFLSYRFKQNYIDYIKNLISFIQEIINNINRNKDQRVKTFNENKAKLKSR